MYSLERTNVCPVLGVTSGKIFDCLRCCHFSLSSQLEEFVTQVCLDMFLNLPEPLFSHLKKEAGEACLEVCL